MTIQEYEILAGINVSSDEVPMLTALINKTKNILELKLGYSLDSQSQLQTREYLYTGKDQFIQLDPFVSINTIQILRNNNTTVSIDTSQYQIITRQGIKRYINVNSECYNTLLYNFRPFNKDYEKPSKLQVTGIFEFVTLPEILQYLWADMITYYNNPFRNLEAQTLGTHSYKRRVDDVEPENTRSGIAIMRRFAGSNGTISSLNIA